MQSITEFQLAEVAHMIGAACAVDDDIEAKIEALLGDPTAARRALDWLPEAFALVFIPHLAQVTLPKTFSARASDGRWHEFPFHAEPIFEDSIRLGVRMSHGDSGETFRKIVLRSSLIAALNNALNEGADLEGMVLSGPALLGIPAETYLPESRSLWRRLFG